MKNKNVIAIIAALVFAFVFVMFIKDIKEVSQNGWNVSGAIGMLLGCSGCIVYAVLGYLKSRKQK